MLLSHYFHNLLIILPLNPPLLENRGMRGRFSQALIEKSLVPVYVIPARYVDNAYDWKRARLFSDYDYMDAVNAVEV